MLRAIAIDDEPKALEVLKLHIAKVPFIDLQSTFRDPVQGLDWLTAHNTELVFLDINMPGISGLELRKLLNPSILVVFTTAYSEHAVESYNLKALDYLVKPIQFDRFLQTAQRAMEMWQMKQQGEKATGGIDHAEEKSVTRTLFIKSGSRHHRIDPNDILYVEKDGNYAVFHLRDKKIISRHTTQQLLELLPQQDFLRVHKSYIVALRHIDIVEPGQITIQNKAIPVAKNYRDAVLRITGNS